MYPVLYGYPNPPEGAVNRGILNRLNLLSLLQALRRVPASWRFFDRCNLLVKNIQALMPHTVISHLAPVI